jgi:hypothetical protein
LSVVQPHAEAVPGATRDARPNSRKSDAGHVTKAIHYILSGFLFSVNDVFKPIELSEENCGGDAGELFVAAVSANRKRGDSWVRITKRVRLLVQIGVIRDEAAPFTTSQLFLFVEAEYPRCSEASNLSSVPATAKRLRRIFNHSDSGLAADRKERIEVSG